MGLIIWFLDALIILFLFNVAMTFLAAAFSNKVTGTLTFIVLAYLVIRYGYLVLGT